MNGINEVMDMVEGVLDLWLDDRRQFRLMDMVYRIEGMGCNDIGIEHELDGLRVRFMIGKIYIEYWVCCLLGGEKECIIRRK